MCPGHPQGTDRETSRESQAACAGCLPREGFPLESSLQGSSGACARPQSCSAFLYTCSCLRVCKIAFISHRSSLPGMLAHTASHRNFLFLTSNFPIVALLSERELGSRWGCSVWDAAEFINVRDTQHSALLRQPSNHSSFVPVLLSSSTQVLFLGRSLVYVLCLSW